MQLDDGIVRFFQEQGYVVVSTVDTKRQPHNSCKGIVEIKKSGKVYLFDLYHGQTFSNLKVNPYISITAVDEHKFKGYCLKGRAQLMAGEKLSAELVKAWDDRITTRLTQRVLRNVSGISGHPAHPEVLLPSPKYLIEMQVEEITDLTPHHLKGVVGEV